VFARAGGGIKEDTGGKVSVTINKAYCPPQVCVCVWGGGSRGGQGCTCEGAGVFVCVCVGGGGLQ
jgi:hypothetical protein